MKKNNLYMLNLLLFNSFNIIANIILDIKKLGYEQYQHIVVNGKILPDMPPTNGQQPETRYKIIESFLQQYQRPFTMLDLGAAQGYHSLRAAWQFPNSVFVMIEGNNRAYPYQGDHLLSICKSNTQLHNIIHLNKSIFKEDLIRLGECEHFDVVLALNIIHWFKTEWQNMINALLYLGDNIIIETPPAEESELKKNIVDYLYSIGAEKIAEVPRHIADRMSPIFLLKSDLSKTLQRSTWLSSKEISITRDYKIISNFQEKKLRKLDVAKKPYKELITSWDPGINLLTFKMYNGFYPLTKTLQESLHTLKDEPHNDWCPNNFIVQGNTLKMIDYNSLYFNNSPVKPISYLRYKEMRKFLEEMDPKNIEKLFYTVASTPRQQLYGS